jgi:hypothetical protein
MQLFNLKNNALLPLSKDAFALEKDIQLLVESNLATLFNLQFVSSEFTIGNFRIDTLAFDEQSDAFVIIEYKKGNSYSVIDQGYSYLSTMLNNKAEFILEFNEKMKRNLKRDQVDWTSSKVIFVSPSFNSYQKNSVNFRDVPFELWEIKRFEGGLVALEQHQSNSSESIGMISAPNSNSVISEVTAEVKTVYESELVSKLVPKMKPVWQALREKLAQYPDTTFYTTKGYIGWRKGSTTITFMYIHKNSIRADILRGNRTEAGEKSKGFFNLDDPKGLANERDWTWKDGKTGHSYLISITEIEQLDYVLYLLNQKYESL